MLVTNQTSSDIYFGPLHLGAGIGTTLTVDDTSSTSLYLTEDTVADALNNAYNSGKITVSGAAQPFPRPTGVPEVLHGDGDPEGLVFAPQGSVFMRRDGLVSNDRRHRQRLALHREQHREPTRSWPNDDRQQRRWLRRQYRPA